ncbi:unnamed protein product [Menidia menidia]|uniref:(Atlantic silverside) hypothetical protein n=1 Tax=Menidia menidia TaxID=238744 RepID=A0A8S4AZ21_9TELE|nr:unnamed protein product [Menidia menidia]
MNHVKKFQSIPMSKSMRGLCKEEDYAFLGTSKNTSEDAGERRDTLEDELLSKKEERVLRRLEWEKQENDRLRAIEESKKEKERQWRIHIAELTSSQEKALQDRLERLRRFREFQRKVLGDEEGMEVQVLTRM